MEDRLTREERGVLAAVIAWFAITAAWWLLALWPVANAPVWLERTRYVCFGVNESGLPDGGGWIGLTAGPAGMLSILVVGWWSSFAALVRKRVGMLGIGSIAIGVLLLAAGGTWRVAEARSIEEVASGSTLPPATYPRLDRPAPALKLVAQNGKEFSIAELRGRPVLLTFAYAHCQTVCPVVVRQTLDAQARLRSGGIAAAVVIVTLDPWRDTPSRLPAMAQSWELRPGEAWVLSGAVEEVVAVLDAWNVPIQRDTKNGEVTHPSLVYILDTNGQIAFAATGGTAQLAELVRRL